MEKLMELLTSKSKFAVICGNKYMLFHSDEKWYVTSKNRKSVKTHYEGVSFDDALATFELYEDYYE